MLFDPARHEPLTTTAWDEGRARSAIEWIVRDSEARVSPKGLWPAHPCDSERAEPFHSLYFGACGVVWALRRLESQGAVTLTRDYGPSIESLLEPNRVAMDHAPGTPFGSYLMGDTGIELLQYQFDPSKDVATRLAGLIRSNIDHPARELMWGAPGTMLAALFMHRHTRQPVWAQLFRESARTLWSQLEWSAGEACHYWTQDMYGQRSNYLDAVHGFVATASPLIQGRDLLGAGEWESWRDCIGRTVRRTAEWKGPLVNWRATLSTPRGSPMLMQYCHGAPGFVICLGDFPDSSLDDLLLAGAEATWAAGPLRKGSNLCHGTGGNGYAFLKLFRRTGDARWLERARAFAMHGIAQTESARETYGRLRYSLWTGDPGFAIYLGDCIRGSDRFPSLDVFFD